MSLQFAKVPQRRIWDKVTPRRTLLFLSAIAVFALFLRCLHLLDPNRYFVASPDSYFFHWLAQRVMAGEGPPADAPAGSLYTLHTGLAYPMAYIAKAMSSVFNISGADSLSLTAKFLPPILGLISIAVIYLAAAKVYDRRVALFSALAWALMYYALLVGAAGYLDRDGLSLLLLMVGAFVFYLSSNWHLHIGKIDIGWVVAGLVVLGLELLLYVEWTFIGPVGLLMVLLVYFLVKLLLGYADRLQTEQSPLRRLTAAVGEVNWRAFTLIIGVNIVAIIVLHRNAAGWFRAMIELFHASKASGVVEMSGLNIWNLFDYQLLLIPMILGIYIAWKKRSSGTIFVLCWFSATLVLGLFSKRVLLYGVPAACLISGVGLAFLWEWRRHGQHQDLRNVGTVALLCLLILTSFVTALALNSDPAMAPSKEWQDALTYLREDTPPESEIMTNWGWGYWILDLGQRRPVVDNGYYYYDEEKLHDVGLAYSTNEPSEAAQIMEKYGADYLVFSDLDLQISGTILGWTGLDDGDRTFAENSLVVTALNGKFQSGAGLDVVFRSAPDSEVVILRLTGSG